MCDTLRADDHSVGERLPGAGSAVSAPAQGFWLMPFLSRTCSACRDEELGAVVVAYQVRVKHPEGSAWECLRCGAAEPIAWGELS